MKKEKRENKICISSEGDTLDFFVDHRLGRCQYFLIINEESGDFDAKINHFAAETGSVDLAIANELIKEGIDVVITGSMGDDALETFVEAEVRVYLGAFGKTVDEAFDDYKKGELAQTKGVRNLNDE